MSDHGVSDRDIEIAKERLIAAGYRVSEGPMPWRTLGAVVEIKVLGETTEKRFVQTIEKIIRSYLHSLASVQGHLGPDVRQFSGPTVKQFSRVMARKRGE